MAIPLQFLNECFDFRVALTRDSGGVDPGYLGRRPAHGARSQFDWLRPQALSNALVESASREACPLFNLLSAENGDSVPLGGVFPVRAFGLRRLSVLHTLTGRKFGERLMFSSKRSP